MRPECVGVRPRMRVCVRVLVMRNHINLNVYKSRRMVMPQGHRLGSTRQAHGQENMKES